MSDPLEEANATIARLRAERDELASRFTNLDKPRYSGVPMMDEALIHPNEDFNAWVDTLPPTYWARYDLSAARIGWEAACEFLRNNTTTKCHEHET